MFRVLSVTIGWCTVIGRVSERLLISPVFARELVKAFLAPWQKYSTSTVNFFGRALSYFFLLLVVCWLHEQDRGRERRKRRGWKLYQGLGRRFVCAGGPRHRRHMAGLAPLLG